MNNNNNKGTEESMLSLRLRINSINSKIACRLGLIERAARATKELAKLRLELDVLESQISELKQKNAEQRKAARLANS